MRVGANSPSLCPTIPSWIYTGMNLLPLCTAKVCPTKSGVTVEARDHVLITFFWFDLLRACTCSIRRDETNGPFFSERAIAYLLRLTMSLPDAFLCLRVFFPFVCQPQGDTGCGFPCGDFPSPPPCGWSTGFMTTPRDCGRMPSQRERPAFPMLMFS